MTKKSFEEVKTGEQCKIKFPLTSLILLIILCQIILCSVRFLRSFSGTINLIINVMIVLMTRTLKLLSSTILCL